MKVEHLDQNHCTQTEPESQGLSFSDSFALKHLETDTPAARHEASPEPPKTTQPVTYFTN